MERLIAISSIIIWLAASGGALAQRQPPDLTVTLHDAASAPLAGVVVMVRDASGSHTLAQATTDVNGAAAFAHLMESQVRVAIAGTLPNGTKLYQPGLDARGISFLLSTLPATLALRSAADGMIAPDPAAMARDIGVPIATSVATIPTAPLALPVSANQADAQAPAAAPAVAEQSSRGNGWQIWCGVAVLIALIGSGMAIVVLQRRAG